MPSLSSAPSADHTVLAVVPDDAQRQQQATERAAAQLQALKVQRRALLAAEAYANQKIINPEPANAAKRKAFHYFLYATGSLGLFLELFFATFATYSGMVGLEVIVAASRDNELLKSGADYDRFAKENPQWFLGSMLVSGLTALADLGSNVYMVSVSEDANALSNYRVPKPLIDYIREHEFNTDAPANIDELTARLRGALATLNSYQPTAAAEASTHCECCNSAACKRALDAALKVTVGVMICLIPFVIGAAGDLVPYGVDVSESPSFLRWFVSYIQDNLWAKLLMTGLIEVGGCTYYAMLQAVDIYEAAENLPKKKLNNPHNLAGTAEAWIQMILQTVMRGAGFGFIAQALTESDDFLGLPQYGAAAFWLGAFFGGINTFVARYNSPFSKYAGNENEFNVPELSSADGTTSYTRLAAQRIAELSLSQRHWAKASGAIFMGFALAAMTKESLDTAQAWPAYALAIGVSLPVFLKLGSHDSSKQAAASLVASAGLAAGIFFLARSAHESAGFQYTAASLVFAAVAAIKWQQGAATQVNQMARAIFHEEKYQEAARACAENQATVFAAAKTALTQNDSDKAAALCAAYEDLRSAREKHFKRAGALDSTLPAVISEQRSARIVAFAIGMVAMAQVSRYLGNMSSSPLLLEWTGSARAAVYFAAAVGLPLAISNFVYSVPKAVEGMTNFFARPAAAGDDDMAQPLLAAAGAGGGYGSTDDPLAASTSSTESSGPGSKTPSPR